MNSLEYYKSKDLNNDKTVFDYFMKTLKKSIFTWDSFVDYKKVNVNITKIEKELNLLNVLIGKKDIEKEFITLITEYPKVRNVLPILVAIRNKKLNEMDVLIDIKKMISKNQYTLFDHKISLNDEIKKDLLTFFKNSGLKDVFQNKDVKNIVDYCFGIEVGMDTNARKNRSGILMENIVESLIKPFCNINGLEYIPQAAKNKVKMKWAIEIESDKANRIFDFFIYDKKKNKSYVIETNFYGGGGSKLKATAGEYRYLNDFLKKQNITLIWITDGVGWKTSKNALYETFLHNNFVFNLQLLNDGVLNEIFS